MTVANSTTFTAKVTKIRSVWLNDINTLVFTVFAGATTAAEAKTALGIGASTIPTTAQGDLLFASGVDTLTVLAKNASATRYLSNTGASNNPAWAQVALATGVSGTLPIANGGTAGTTAAGARTALGLDTMATQASGAVAITGGTVAGITDLAVADGGTGSSTAAAARTALAAMEQVFTTRGDLVRGGVSGVPERVALGTSGQILTSNGTDAAWASPASSGASQSDQETATSTTTWVSPAKQQFHPSAVKVWCKAGTTGNVVVSYNMTSVTDVGVGSIAFTIATDFSGADWCGSLTPLASGTFLLMNLTSQAAGTSSGICVDSTFASVDPVGWLFVGLGDQ